MVNGDYFCHTLELPKGKCIPEGEYSLVISYSPKFKRIMPLISSVPMFQGIRIHPGNRVADSEGCILVGYDSGTDPDGSDNISRSKVCSNELNNYLIEANKNQVLAIEIKEG